MTRCLECIKLEAKLAEVVKLFCEVFESKEANIEELEALVKKLQHNILKVSPAI